MFQRYSCLVAIWLLLAIAVHAQPDAQIVVSGAWGRDSGQFAHAVDGAMSGPSSFTIDTLGDVYVIDNVNDRIQQFTPEGKFANAYAVPHGACIDCLTVSLELAPDGKGVRSRTIYAVEQSGYGFIRMPMQIYCNATGGMQRLPAPLPLPGITVKNLATESRHCLFIEAQGDKDRIPSTWLLDERLGYRGHRDIADICIQPGNENLIGVAQKLPREGQPDMQRWGIQFFSPTDMQYSLIKTVEINVPAVKYPDGVSKLIGVDKAGNLYVFRDTVGATLDARVTQVLRYAPTGKQTGILGLEAPLRDNQYVLYPARNTCISPTGDVYLATGTEKRYVIQRLIWPQTNQ